MERLEDILCGVLSWPGQVRAFPPLELQKHAESLSIESCCQKIRPLNSLTLQI